MSVDRKQWKWAPWPQGLAWGCLMILVAAAPIDAQPNRAAPLQAVPFQQVDIQSAFWAQRIATNHESTVPHCLEWCEKTGRIDNFAKAGGLMDGDYEGLYFNDSDVYKVLEGVIYSLEHYPDPALEARLDSIIETIAAAQEANGYLNTFFQLSEPDNKWTNLKDRHELYCAGHLLEAGVAHYQITGKESLLNVAQDFIHLIDKKFGPDKRHDVPGHEEIELALIRLYRLTGEQSYLDLATFFIEERGHDEHRALYGKYCQDHRPVREQEEVFGHAVRAMYLFSAVADLAMETGDAALAQACQRIWEDLTQHKMYITGGIGVSGHGEGFAGEYHLPNFEAYSETCASIALAFFAHRMNLLFGDAHYADVFERVLYNGLISGVSLHGDQFFYRNPLASHGPETFETSGGKQGDSKQHRQHWFECACCPSNMVRFVPKVGEYLYAHADDAVYVNQYMASDTTLEVGGEAVTLQQRTNYPWDGFIDLGIQSEKPAAFDLMIRVPGWADTHRIRVNGLGVDAPPQKGYVKISRTWQSGDRVEIEFPMKPKRIQANPMITADLGKTALMAGPVVYCLEEVDNGFDLWCFSLPLENELELTYRADLLGGANVIEGEGLVWPEKDWHGALYRPAGQAKPVSFTAIPYCLWDNREPGDMLVWLP